MPRETANEHIRNCLMLLGELERRLAAGRRIGAKAEDLRELTAGAQRRCWAALAELEPGPHPLGPNV